MEKLFKKSITILKKEIGEQKTNLLMHFMKDLIESPQEAHVEYVIFGTLDEQMSKDIKTEIEEILRKSNSMHISSSTSTYGAWKN